VITRPCRKHPTYKAIRKPVSCGVCWAIYNKVHGIAGRPAAEPTLENDLRRLLEQTKSNLLHERLRNTQEIIYWRRQWRQPACRFATLAEETLTDSTSQTNVSTKSRNLDRS